MHTTEYMYMQQRSVHGHQCENVSSLSLGTPAIQAFISAGWVLLSVGSHANATAEWGERYTLNGTSCGKFRTNVYIPGRKGLQYSHGLSLKTHVIPAHTTRRLPPVWGYFELVGYPTFSYWAATCKSVVCHNVSQVQTCHDCSPHACGVWHELVVST